MGCASVQIKDEEFCGDQGELGATCFHTLTDETRDLSKADWDALRFGQVCSSAQTFADWKASILKLCKVSKACTYEQKKLLNQFMAHIEALQ